MGFLLLGLLAGALTTLSPCVLPVLPFVVFAALDRHRFGPIALAAGMASAFAIVGILVAGAAPVLDGAGNYARTGAAILMLLFGIVLISPVLQDRAALALGPLSARMNDRLAGFSPDTLGGQFALGALLGAVWTPCSGPTLGAAVGLAANSATLPAAASIMVSFGLGASLPLVGIAYGSRQTLKSRRALAAGIARYAKPFLGIFMAAIGLAVLSGVDKLVEAALVNAMPDWLVTLTTRY